MKKVILIISFLLIFIISGYFIFKHFRLTEEMARETTDRFLNMLVMKDFDSMKDVYPNVRSIGYLISINNGQYFIKHISRNSDGNFDIYVSLQLGENNFCPLYFVVSRKNNKTIITSSKGINYARYDKLLEFGKRKGCLTGNEDDVLMGQIIDEKNLKIDFEALVENIMRSLILNIKTSNSLQKQYSYTNGDVTITNNNDIGLEYPELECRIEFYDINGNITNSENLLINSVNAHSSVSSPAWSSSSNSVSFKIIPTIKKTESLKSRIKDLIIENTSFGC